MLTSESLKSFLFARSYSRRDNDVLIMFSELFSLSLVEVA